MCSSVLKNTEVGSVVCAPSTGARRIASPGAAPGKATAELEVPKSIAQKGFDAEFDADFEAGFEAGCGEAVKAGLMAGVMATPRGTSHAALRKAGRTGFVSRKRGAEQPQGRGAAPQIKRAASAARFALQGARTEASAAWQASRLCVAQPLNGCFQAFA
ncbi:hypothetical protein PSP6_340050 [Paraburkholderia tropica]|nr:hypothetical protein PSP6_340050 [Paraburkholderia tropica]